MTFRSLLTAFLSFSAFGLYAQPCTLSDPTNCECLGGGTDCDLLPDIKLSADLLADSTVNIEYPQTGAGSNNGRLRVSVSTPNIGHGPLTVKTTNLFVCGKDTFNFDPGTCADGTEPRNIINQRVYHKNDSVMTYTDRYAGTMTFHPTHNHMHVDDWGYYTLRLKDDNEPNPLDWPIIADGAKLAFCLMDYGTCTYYSDTANMMGHCRDDQDKILLNSDFANWGLGGGGYNCSAAEQGISVGWTDIYYQYLSGMWADIPPGTCNGEYFIVVHVDPYDYFKEENEDNNVVAVPFELRKQEPAGSNPNTIIGAKGSFVVNDTVRVCESEPVTLVASPGYSYSWSTGDTTRTISALTTGVYAVTVDAPCGIDSATVEVVTVLASPPIAVGDTICENTTATLDVTSGGTISWYDAPTGGTLVGTGSSFTTPPLSKTTSFYAESVKMIEGHAAHVGAADSSIGSGNYNTGNHYLIFDVDEAATLKSVKVHANGAANRTIQLRDQFGVVVHDTVISIPNGESRVQLDFPLTVGKDFQLGVLNGSSPDLWRTTNGVSFPYALDGTVKIKSSSSGSGLYYFFYDWEIQLEDHLCSSARTAVEATVRSPITVWFTGLDSVYHVGDPAATLNGNPGGGSFTGNGVTGNMFDPTSAGAGEHTITYLLSDAHCTYLDAQTARVLWPVGVNEPSQPFLQIVPSVSTGTFEVLFEATSGNAAVQVFDAAGRIVDSRFDLGHHFSELFDLSALGAGVYFVDVMWEEGSARERVVVLGE